MHRPNRPLDLNLRRPWWAIRHLLGNPFPPEGQGRIGRLGPQGMALGLLFALFALVAPLEAAPGFCPGMASAGWASQEPAATSPGTPPAAAPQAPETSAAAEAPGVPPAAPLSNRVKESPPAQDNPGHAPAAGELGRGGRNRVAYRIQARLDPRPAAVKAPQEPSAPADSADPASSADPAEPEVPGLAAPERDHFVLQGSLEMDLENLSGESLNELWFHLYLNAFANNRSTHLIASRGMLRDTKVSNEWGYSEIRAIRLLGAGEPVDLLPSLSWRWPTVPNPDDRTVFTVALPQALESGAKLTVAIEWESVLPRVRRRTGTKGDFIFLGHWFPKLGVYEPGRGWNCHPFHAFTEWYADFGTYDVRFDLPAEYANKVFASGVRTNQVDRGERVQVSFAAPSEEDRALLDRMAAPTAASQPQPRRLHDFAMAADPDFRAFSKPFRFDEWAARFPEEVERARRAFGAEFSPALREVIVDVAIQEERKVQAERHYEAACAALFFYGLWFGEYPFERLTVIDPAYGASEAAGMEYPTLFTAGTRLFTRRSMHSPESVTIHEAGHQWFQGIVASNEFEAAWLDEGLNTYADSEVLFRVYGLEKATTDYAGIPFDGVQLARFGSGLSGRILSLERIPLGPGRWLGLDGPLELIPRRASGFLDFWREQPLFTLAPRHTDPRQADRRGYLSSPDVDPIVNYAWNARDRNSHYTNTYARTGTMLRSLPVILSASQAGLDGEAAFLRGMRRYASLWRFGHPYPEDFFEALAAGSAPELDLEPYFRDLFRGTGRGDWAVNVRQEKMAPPKGFMPDEAGRYRLLAQPAGKAADKDAEWELEVLLSRQGELCLPVPVRLEFADGQVVERIWTRAEQQERTWLRLEFRGPHKLVSAEIDPAQELYLDGNKANDRWYEASDSHVGWRWAERIFSQLSQRLTWQKSLGG
jgi:Peptidase family M1 domain